MRILVTGASGALGSYVLERLAGQGHELFAWSGNAKGERSGIELEPIDLTASPVVAAALETIDPDVILHLAAISSAAEVLRDPQRAEAINVASTMALVAWCETYDRRLIFTSTDLVFSGEKPWNREEDPALPRLLYGRMKAAAESPIRTLSRGLVARMPLMFGPSKSGRPGFFDQTIADLRDRKPRTFFEDEYRTPLDYDTAASLLIRLITSKVTGILHVAGTERVSRFDLMQRIASTMGLDASLVKANRQVDVPGPEPRPADVSLSTETLMTIFPDLIRPTIDEVARAWR